MSDLQRYFSRKYMALMAVVAMTLVACGDNETPLPGERLSIRPGDATEVENRIAAISFPPATHNTEWTHKNGAPNHVIGHLAFNAAPALVWSADIGNGVSRGTRISAAPIGADGMVFVLDGAAQISALDGAGAILWSLDVTPAGENPGDGSGGGLSYSGGVLYAATGFGEILAITPTTGGVIWRRGFDAPFRAAPSVVGNTIFAVTRADVAYAISTKDGKLAWLQRGAGAIGSAYNGGASPAVSNGQVILPFSTGDLVMVRANSGQPRWRSALDGGRASAAINVIGDISGDPVIDGNKVYAANLAGQTVQINLQNGKRNWALPVGAMGPVWPVAGAVFLVSDHARMMRIDARNGQVIWAQQLPQFSDPEDREGVIRYHGPVLAGGAMWVTSHDGHLRAFAPESGEIITDIAVPGGAASAPIVIGGVLYILSLDGKLHAFQ